MTQKKALPTFYYLSHFHEFLSFIKGPCKPLLSEDHTNFISKFESLTRDQQCILVRSCNRKLPFFKVSSFQYAEIEHIHDNIEYLTREGWFSPIKTEHYDEWILALTKSELKELLSPNGMISSAATKCDLIEQARQLDHLVVSKSSVITGYRYRALDTFMTYFLYLYFGSLHKCLNQFSMRDLGVMRTRKEQAQVISRFSSRQIAECNFEIDKLLNKQKKQPCSNEQKLIEIFESIPKAIGERAYEHKNRLIFLLANSLMPSNPSLALSWLESIMTSEAQEKWCREAYKLGYKSEVESKLESLIKHPISDDNLHFAEDFLARKFNKKKTSALTDMLRNNVESITLDELHKTSVERGVMSEYHRNGKTAIRTENEFWRSLFGLYFWEEIFDMEGNGLINEFDKTPLCLSKDCLFESAEAQIISKNNLITSNEDLVKFIQHQSVKHYGKQNNIFQWRPSLLEKMNVVLNAFDYECFISHLIAMSQNWSSLSDGYPDIFVIDKGCSRFEEIKSEGDQIRRNQLLTIKKLREHGFDVRITQVEWSVDPNQPYVIVDVETTGGGYQHHRITEIGMVKMVNNQVVDQWQTLINPQRNIPSNIVSLTGIDNEMVRHSPLFVEVADEVLAFMEGCVFVAHNVNFDYGFFKREFERLERRFKMPKLCTVSQMRKYYKGLSSYSLANLTEHFNIKMDQHHRALSDAMAASELLKLINLKRVN